MLITADQNLRYQQNLAGRKLGLIILPTNYTPAVVALAPKIAAALANVTEGSWVEISQ